MAQIHNQIANALTDACPDLRLAMLFGSFAEGRARPDSDIDIAVWAREPLDAAAILSLTGAVADECGRHADIVDLHHIPLPVTGIALRGTRLVGSDADHGALCSRYLIAQEDFGKLRDRLLERKLAAWIRE